MGEIFKQRNKLICNQAQHCEDRNGNQETPTFREKIAQSGDDTAIYAVSLIILDKHYLNL